LIISRKADFGNGGGAERRLWRIQRGGSPVRQEAQGSRASGNAARPCRTVGRVGSSNLLISSISKKQHPEKGAVLLFSSYESSGTEIKEITANNS